MRKQKSRFVAISIISIAAIWLTGCLNVRPIHNPHFNRYPTAQQTGRPPIIIVPGIMGSILTNQKTGQKVWPTLDPKDNELRLPISPDIKSNRSNIVATEVVGSAKLAPFFSEVHVYQGLIDSLAKNGYRLGNINNPSKDGDRDTIYLFPYDWRRDNVETAQMLAEKIASLQQKLGRPDLKFDIIGHSTGGLIARYYLMYGGADLPVQTGATVPWAGSANINRLILIATPNEGSVEVFEALVEGYTLIHGTLRKIVPERKIPTSVLFTFPSAYQLLPHPGTEKFYNSRGQQVAVDLYNTETWRRFRWGVYGSEHHSSNYRPTAEQESYLKVVLERARLFDQALDRKPDPAARLNIFILASDCMPTLSGAFLIEHGGQSRTVFSEHGTGLSESVARSLIFEPGDTRVTRPSAVAAVRYNPTDKMVLESYLSASPAIFVCGRHSKLLNNKALQENVLGILRGGAASQSVRLP